MSSIVAIGECMLEFSRQSDGCYRLGFGGDTLNTAVYLARLDCSVDYCTALGEDAHSDRLLAAWREEGVGTARVARLVGRSPGLYLIETDDEGDRHFSYWRDTSAARDLFTGERGQATAEALADYDLIYLSGITLSLYDQTGRERLWQGLDRARAKGSRVAFDTNFRPRGWPSVDEARATYAAMLARTDILLSGIEDERALFGIHSSEAALRRGQELEIGESLVKHGASGCSVLVDDRVLTVTPEPVAHVVDTTAAGDSFNAGYLAARLHGADAESACGVGHRLAGVVIGHQGAIIPRSAMPEQLRR
jgi:2-dehydro-3-deoxygluconokinase